MSLLRSYRPPVTTWWEDGKDPLETRIAEIAADLIVAGEAAFREGLIEAREHAERIARWRAEAHAEELKRLRKKRRADLEESGELLRQASAIRTLVAEVDAAVAGGTPDLSDAQLARWRRSAVGEADRLDPVLSGQVMSHLVVPAAR